MRRGAHGASGIVLAVLVACAVAGCAADVVMLEPRTGKTERCHSQPMNPWSQQERCIADHIAGGWVKRDDVSGR